MPKLSLAKLERHLYGAADRLRQEGLDAATYKDYIPMSETATSRVAERALVLMGQSPPSSACSENGDGLPFIQGNAEFGIRYPKPRMRCSSPTRIAESGDLLLSVRAPVGALNEAPTRMVIGRGLSALRFADQDREFAWHALMWSASALNRVAQGSTFVAVSRQDVESLRIPWFDGGNQRIAIMLDTVDEAIARTEAVIAKLKQVRTGSIHDLLTRGLDEHGQLRDPIAHPEQFQDSPLGPIPREWQYQTLQEACDWVSGGTPDRSHASWWRGTVPFLTPKDMKSFELHDTSEHVTDEAVNAGSRLMPTNTVFIVVRGMILAHTFPVCLCLRPFAFNQDIKAVRSRGRLTNRFLAQWFAANAALFLRKATEATHGAKKLDTNELHRAAIGVPSSEEQESIVDRIQAIDAIANKEAATLAKLDVLKSGLMTDLLTGRVRVPEHVGVGGAI